MPLFGAHMSVAGGLDRAVRDIMAVEGRALQLFTKNQRQWQFGLLDEQSLDRFAALREEWGPWPVVSHASYLINLASPREDQADKSVRAMQSEIRRCAQASIPWIVLHPGSHMGQGTDQGLSRFTRNLDRALDSSPDSDQDHVGQAHALHPDATHILVLLETTAGQGTNLGAAFHDIARIIDASRHPERLGVCYDTCHAYAAGYDIRNPETYQAVMTEFDRYIGLDRLRLVHLNDSLTPLGSRRDRHTHIGQGHIGLEGFRLLVDDPRFRRMPMILETPKEEDLEDDRRNLALLRSLLR